MPQFVPASDQGIQLVHGEMPYYMLGDIRLSFDIHIFIQSEYPLKSAND